MIRTVIVALWTVVVTVLSACAASVSSVWRKGGKGARLVGYWWARLILFPSGVKVCVEGLHHIDRGQTYICMANHQSMFDILVLFAYLPVDFRWLAKKELFSIPLFGYSMGRAGHISIDRSDRKAAHSSLLEASRKIASGTSVVIFPEGSRSPDGQIMPFKAGGFHLAVRSGRPILPVVISGTADILPKGRLCISPGTVTISVNAPVEAASYGKDKNALMGRVRDLMRRDLERIRVARGSAS